MSASKKTFLFLQGPISPFFTEISTELKKLGHIALKINLNFGDTLFWDHPGAVNYKQSQAEWPEFIQSFLEDNAVTDIVLLGEQRFYHKVAIEAAKARGIQIVATDFGYIRPDWITLEKNGLSGSSLFPKEPDDIRSLAEQCPKLDSKQHYRDSFPRMALWDMQYHLSSVLLWFLFPGYKSHQLHNPVLVYLGTGLRLLKSKRADRIANQRIDELIAKKVPFFVFPLQMATDYSLRAYSRYSSLQQVIKEIFESFSNHAPSDSLLVVKIHPLDPGIENWEKAVADYAAAYGISQRVVFLHGGNLLKLLAQTEGVVTVNSTVGIWALMEGAPIIALGDAIYKINGLVHNGELDGFWNDPTKPDASLCEAYLRAIAGTLQIRGVFYNRPGLDVAVSQAVTRLDQGLINTPHDFNAER